MYHSLRFLEENEYNNYKIKILHNIIYNTKFKNQYLGQNRVYYITVLNAIS